MDWMSRLEKKRLDALARRESVSYFEACTELGIEPEDRHLYELGLFEVARREQNRTERNLSDKLRESLSKYERHQRFVAETDRRGVKVNDVFADTDVKIELLRGYGWNGLVTGKGRTSTVLEDCKPERIGSAFKKLYYSEQEKPDKSS